MTKISSPSAPLPVSVRHTTPANAPASQLPLSRVSRYDTARAMQSSHTTLSHHTTQHILTPRHPDPLYSVTKIRLARSLDNSAGPVDRATTSAAALLSKLSSVDAQIIDLLQRQPNARAATDAAFTNALEHAYPDLPQPVDPNFIYVTQYTEPTEDAASIGMFSQTLTQALRAFIIGTTRTTTSNQSRTGFFYVPNNIDSINEVDEMKGTQHLLKFEQVLRQESTPTARLRHYLDALQAFWNTPDDTLGTNQTPAMWLARQYSLQRVLEAQLRVNDGTLTTNDEKWLTSVFDARCTQNPPGTFALSLQDKEKGIPLSGVLMLTQSPNETPDTTSGRVLLSIPGQGLIAFTSSADYRPSLQQLLNDPAQRAALLTHVAREDQEAAASMDNAMSNVMPFRYRAITGDVAIERIQSQLTQQNRDIAYAAKNSVGHYPLHEAALDQAANLQATFSVSNLLDKRKHLLVQQFLQSASPRNQKKWFKELKQYQQALLKAQTEGLPAMAQYLDPDFLRRYTNTYISNQIKQDLQLDIDPDQVIVTTYELSLSYPMLGDLPPPPGTNMAQKVATHSRLTDLALANTRMLDQDWGDAFPVTDLQGKPLPQLTRQYLTSLIRTANIGQRYQDMLQAHLLDSAEGKARERSYAQFMQAQLLLDARGAQIRNEISEESRQWIAAFLESKPIQINQRIVGPRDLKLDDNELNGIFIFGTTPPDTLASELVESIEGVTIGSPKIVVYTPGAPDDRRLREYATREQMNRDFVNNPAMRNYLLQRIDRPQQAAVSQMLEDGIVDNDITDTVIGGNFLHAAYRAQAAHIIADANARTISNDEADRQAWWDKFNKTLDVAGILLPIKLSIPLALARAGYALYSAHDAHQRGNNEEALADFLNSLTLLSNAAADGVHNMAIDAPVVPVDAPGTTRRVINHSSTSASSTPALTSPAAAPPGMSTAQIEDHTYFYWNSPHNMAGYRNLFAWDPDHPGQLKSAGHAAPDEQNVWKKIAPLKGGGGGQSIIPAQSVEPLIKKMQILGQNFLSAKIDGKYVNVRYDFEKNAFRDASILGKNDNIYYTVRDGIMHKLTQVERTISDAERQATLRLIDIDLTLPLGLNATAPVTTRPIPSVINSVWIGDQVISDALAKNLGRNASMATVGENRYTMRLYLSSANARSFAENMDKLRIEAPALQVINLESSQFYLHFRNSKYFRQYRAALDGNGGIASNFASAADVLRYRLLHHTGGIYMDADDKLTQSPGNIEIKTSSTGLALNTPVSLKILDMDIQYTNSIFGSQKYNPTLDAISEESYRRFLQNENIYQTPRPKKSTHSEQKFNEYMKKISYVTGPNVFNKIIDERLPDMYQMREALKFSNNGSIDMPQVLRNNIGSYMRARLPLVNISLIGNAHTWHENR